MIRDVVRMLICLLLPNHARETSAGYSILSRFIALFSLIFCTVVSYRLGFVSFIVSLIFTWDTAGGVKEQFLYVIS